MPGKIISDNLHLANTYPFYHYDDEYSPCDVKVEHTKTERNVLAMVDHPFLLTLRFSFQTDEKLYMLTDYCPGGELFFHLKNMRRFTEGMVRFYRQAV